MRSRVLAGLMPGVPYLPMTCPRHLWGLGLSFNGLITRVERYGEPPGAPGGFVPGPPRERRFARGPAGAYGSKLFANNLFFF